MTFFYKDKHLEIAKSQFPGIARSHTIHGHYICLTAVSTTDTYTDTLRRGKEHCMYIHIVGKFAIPTLFTVGSYTPLAPGN